ncbi:hypothetical protein [Nostoc sp.]|uniref:hypothetical protein n=1 Tax=Nostoc sp. TaxID=1180 RepID=UPI002FFC9749
MGHWAWGIGHGALGMGHWLFPSSPPSPPSPPSPSSPSSPPSPPSPKGYLKCLGMLQLCSGNFSP